MRSAVFSLIALLLLALLATACDQPRPVQVVAGADRLPGLYWEPPKPLSRAVLLVHMLGRSKEDWIPLATRLRQAGYGVLAIDLREQGRTGAPELLADLRAGFDFLRAEKKVDAARIGIVGASIGANAALNLAAQEPLVRLTALLSPGLNYRGVTTEPALRDYGARPLFLAAAEEDLASARAVRRLAQVAQGTSVTKLYPGRAHGTDLLTVVPGLEQELLAFLQAHL